MTNETVLERTSNLVMPSHYVELDREEMAYVDGGISFSSKGLYFSYDDILVISMVVGTNAYAVASCMTMATSWICSTGIGTILWGIFAISSVAIALKALSAFTQGKGLLLSIEWVKIWFLSIPCGLNLDIV